MLRHSVLEYNLTFIIGYGRISDVVKKTTNVGVAQLDRASGYGPEGREFESSRPRCKDLLMQVLFDFIGNSVPMKLKRLRKDRTEGN